MLFIVVCTVCGVSYKSQEEAIVHATKFEGYEVASYYTHEEDNQHFHV